MTILSRGNLVGIFAAVALCAGTATAQDYVYQEREAAKTWGMQRIAVVQAEMGDVQGAKRTLTQIDDDCPRRTAEVTVVRFCNGMPIYCPAGCFGAARQFPPRNDAVGFAHSPRPSLGGRGGQLAGWTTIGRAPSANHVPAIVPPGLPTDYFAADASHGDLIDFSDEYDAGGTRVTVRRYADGYTLIETPR